MPMDFALSKLTNLLFIIVWVSYQDLNPVSNSCEKPKLGRTVYYMLKRKELFDAKRFFKDSVHELAI